MARLATTGFEWNDTSNLIGGPDGDVGSSGATIDNATFRSGAFSGKVDVTVNGNARIVFFSFTGSTTTTYFARAYVNFSSLGTNSSTPTAVLAEASVKTGICLVNSSLQWLIPGAGSATGATFTPSTGRWYRLEYSYQSSSGAWEWRVDANTIATGTNTSATAPTDFLVGPALVRSGASFVAYFDDIALNDSTGTSQNSFPGEGKIVLLKPVSLNANGGSWTDDNSASTSAALTDAIDNSPPNGIANTTSGGGNHMVRNSAANTNLDMNLTDYATAGLVSGDVVNVLIPQCVVGAPVVTGAKTGAFGILSNPTIAQRTFTGGASAAANYWRGAAAGTYPSNWGWEVGTTTYSQSVTVGTQPVARLAITGGTAARIALCCDLGMYVDYKPATNFVPVPTHLPFV